ncbi:MAG: hypothetical protein JW884_01770 [Deltaproteobacteria bacterium]|nr:hypothetical protein [Deltaproteobacteria bacterium]
MKRLLIAVFLSILFIAAPPLFALERGAILYHASQEGLIYGQTNQLILPCSVIEATNGELGSGHAGLYIGNGRIIHAIRFGVVEEESNNFITADDVDRGCQYMGAKVPVDYGSGAVWPPERKDQLIVIAREQLGKGYDFQFRHQKGTASGEFTCVGFVEYVFEQVEFDITPNGYYQGGAGGKTYEQVYNCESTLWFDWNGTNTFAELVEFSKFEHPLADIGNVGFLHEGRRHIFFPYTQYLQTTTVGVATDVPVSGGAGSDSSQCFISTIGLGR